MLAIASQKPVKLNKISNISALIRKKKSSKTHDWRHAITMAVKNMLRVHPTLISYHMGYLGELNLKFRGAEAVLLACLTNICHSSFIKVNKKFLQRYMYTLDSRKSFSVNILYPLILIQKQTFSDVHQQIPKHKIFYCLVT